MAGQEMRYSEDYCLLRFKLKINHYERQVDAPVGLYFGTLFLIWLKPKALVSICKIIGK